MPIYLPIAEMSVNGGLIIALGMLVGFFSGLFGVGGGFLTTPFLMFIGIPPYIAAATQTCQIVASSSTGVISQWQRQAVDFKLALYMMAGGAAGALGGLGVFKILQTFGQIDLFIALAYMLILGSIGLLMVSGIIKSILTRKKAKTTGENRVNAWLKTLPHQTVFEASSICISLYGPIGIGFISGFLLMTLGTGAGFIMVPAMLYFLGMPALMVTGTSLLQLFVLAALSGILHAATTNSVDLMLAALLIAGSVVGTVLGLRATRYIHGAPARALLAALLLFVAIRMGMDLALAPANPFTLIMEL